MTILEKPHRAHHIVLRGWVPVDFLDPSMDWKKAVRLRNINRHEVLVAKEDNAIPDCVGPREVSVEIRTNKRSVSKYGVVVSVLDALAHNHLIDWHAMDMLLGTTAVDVVKSPKREASTTITLYDMYAMSDEMNEKTKLIFCPVCRKYNDVESVYKGTCSTCGYSPCQK